ncbi:UNVERIFIED_ORG: hypothetical protein J2811_004093 [Burkholderia cepacia]|nr:hypothetical protein [Burkholderia cepacia]MDP9596465.1 hypothetical protein [Burkholderia cepacia]MDP9624637.1 hypothetical protein [Burkholderia cepacia]MDP9670722.1 hypothetical protein [Burkholderia cepacia]MDP9717731.1 hypothetical protein [Burkholderia cepacia]
MKCRQCRREIRRGVTGAASDACIRISSKATRAGPKPRINPD